MIKKILVSQPKPASDKSPYYDLENDFGVECDFRPFFKVEGVSAQNFREQHVNILDYTAVVFTSRHARQLLLTCKGDANNHPRDNEILLCH